MASWILIPCLIQLRAEFDRIAPNRGKLSDGSIGDTAHQQEVSDHNPDETGSVPIHDADKINEVHAIDVSTTLNLDGVSMEQAVQFLLGRCRSGAENRLRYMIYNRRIWSASSGWVQKAYTGASAHTEHAHFSASYDSTHEASTASWHLEDLVALSDADKAWIRTLNEDTIDAVVAAIEKRMGDVVPRVNADGTDVPATDSNPTIVPGTALHNLMRDTAQIKASLAATPQAQ